MTLDKLNIGDKCIIKKIKETSKIKRRLLDIGLTEGTKVECVLASPSNDSLAYFFRKTVIAIRKIDAKEIEVVLDEKL